MAQITQLSQNLFQIADTCNVYVVTRGTRAVAIDFGDGAWLPALGELGVERLEHVFLTHHHADQCAGLQTAKREFVVHAPAGEERFLDPVRSRDLSGEAARLAKGCPESYSPLPGGLEGVTYDMAGFSDLFWGDERIRFLHTPGHGPNACSLIIDVDGKQMVFCGDSFHAGATVWKPFNLEWDHWTGSGVLAAWEGVERLRGVHADLLCPSHGPVVSHSIQEELMTLSKRLLAFYQAKGQISPDEPDRYLVPSFAPGARRVLPSLYQFGVNGYLLCSTSDEALVVDPFLGDMPALEVLLAALPGIRPTASVVSHYHFDHCDAIPYLREKFGTKAYLHPVVERPLRTRHTLKAPWLPTEPVEADQLWPEKGEWRWNEYEFNVAAWPGQTWGHCLFMTIIDGKRVAFGGDSFQPASRWNGTGGFCAYNRSRFREGFAASAKLITAWRPDIVATGHATYVWFSPEKYKKIIGWAEMAERVVRQVCPGGDLKGQYYNISPEAKAAGEAFETW